MSEEFSKTPASKLLLPAIIVLGTALRRYRLGSESLWFDELYAVWANRLPVGGLVREHLASGHPPLYYLIMRGWFAISADEVWIRSFSVMAGAATIWLVYLAGRDLYSRQAGLWGATFAAFSPILVWYSRAATFYSFMIALTTLSFYMLVRCSLRGGWLNWAGYTAVVIAVFFTYFYAGILLVAGAAVFLLLHERGLKARACGGRQLVPWLVSTGILAMAAAGSFAASRQAISESTSRLHLPGTGELAGLLYTIAVAPFVLAAGPLNKALNYKGTEGAPKNHLLALLLAIAALVAVIAVSSGARRWFLKRKTLAVCAFILILMAGPLMLQLVNNGLLSGRFYAWTAPVLMLLAGAIVAALPGNVRTVTGAAMLAGLLALSVWTILGLPERDADWRSLMGEVARQQRDGDRLLCFPQHNCVMAAGYYLPGGIQIAGGMPSFTDDYVYFMPPGAGWTGYSSGYWAGTGASPPLTGGELKSRVGQDLAGADRVWLVSEPGLFQKYPSVGAALFDGWREADSRDYGYFRLRLYERDR